MASGVELKQIAQKRFKSAQELIAVDDWDGAHLMMGLSLECALKAVTCKTLNLDNYPETRKDKNINAFFKTHNFDALLVVSGTDNIFGVRGTGEPPWNWSEFLKEYEGDWWNMKYDLNRMKSWDDVKIKKLYNHLNGLIGEIEKEKLW